MYTRGVVGERKTLAIHVGGIQLERVASANLLGLTLADDLSHVNGIMIKANKCMYTLTLLRRSKVACSDIVKIFCTKIRPILE